MYDKDSKYHFNSRIEKYCCVYAHLFIIGDTFPSNTVVLKLFYGTVRVEKTGKTEVVGHI